MRADAGTRRSQEQRPGHGSVVVRRSSGVSSLVETYASSPLRFVCPSFPETTAASVCLVTFGGGLVDGDEIVVDLEVKDDATLVAFTQSSTKVFRGTSSQRIRARVDGRLVLLPDPVSAFAGARYTQRIDVTLGRNGACILLDGFTAGRPAFGERWAMTSLDLRTIVSIEGEGGDAPLLVDALHLDASDGAIADRMGDFNAFATLVALGRGIEPIATTITRDPVAPPSPSLVTAASPLPRAAPFGVPGAIVRVAASSPADALVAVRRYLRNLPDIDVVDPFLRRY